METCSTYTSLFCCKVSLADTRSPLKALHMEQTPIGKTITLEKHPWNTLFGGIQESEYQSPFSILGIERVRSIFIVQFLHWSLPMTLYIYGCLNYSAYVHATPTMPFSYQNMDLLEHGHQKTLNLFNKFLVLTLCNIWMTQSKNIDILNG